MKNTQTPVQVDFYDYVVNSTTMQKKLLPFPVLYGDGTRWKKQLKTCLTTYQAIKVIMFENNLIDENYRLKEC
jgi:hypothetical protein